MTVTHPDPSLSAAVARGPEPVQLLRYSFMALSRAFDVRFELMRRSGRLGKWYSAVGNEATTVPAGLALQDGDALCTLHRDLGAILATYLDPTRAFPDCGFAATPNERRPDPRELLFRLAAQLLGRDAGFSRGIERSFHYGLLAPSQGILHLGMISHLGSMIPVAAGCGLAFRCRGTDRVAIGFIGEGGTSTGDFHEGLNLAAVWQLPFVLVIENNGYAFSTPIAQQYRARRLSDRAIGYGIAGVQVDGNDPDAVAEVLDQAVARARSGGGPTLVEAMVGRMRGHSEGDDSLKVVPDEEMQGYLEADPVPRYRARLLALGAREELLQRVEGHVHELVETAIEAALQSPPPSPETAWRGVFLEPPEPPEPNVENDRAGSVVAEQVQTSYVDAVRLALLDELESDPSVVLMGQDIGIFEGAFRATRELHQRHPGRVLDTPIAESGTLGAAAGAALLGLRPVVEMQFADFVSCGFNQLVNVAAKFFYRWEQACPMVVRLPAGGGVGAGAFHSQNPEAWFAHVAGLKVVAPATAEDAYVLLRAAIRDPNPVVFLEHKFLYRRIKGMVPQPLERLGEARVRRSGTAITLIGYGATTWTCLEAAAELEKEGVEAEVIDLRTLVPLDLDSVLGSVRKTGRVVVVSEAQETLSFASEVAALVADKAFSWLDAPVRRVTYPDRPVPYVKALERELLPSTARVLSATRELLDY